MDFEFFSNFRFSNFKKNEIFFEKNGPSGNSRENEKTEEKNGKKVQK